MTGETFRRLIALTVWTVPGEFWYALLVLAVMGVECVCLYERWCDD